jgi:hypothetical protein
MLFLSAFVFGCSTVGARKVASSGSSAASLIAADLSAQVAALSTPVYAYSYTSGTPLGSSTLVWQDLSTVEAKYLDLSTGKIQNDLPGLYLALDPISSREFGGPNSNWLLYRIELPRGFRYLDISKLDYAPLSQNIVTALAAEGCIPTGEYLAHFNYSALLKQNLGPTCRQIGIQALRQMNVQALGYSYSAISFPNCISSHAMAFIAFNLTGISASSAAEFSLSTENQNPVQNEELFTEHLFVESNWTTTLLYNQGRLWPDLDSIAVDGNSYLAWKKSHLLNCN